jgi:cytochrome oxidase assembly protein ShyY1
VILFVLGAWQLERGLRSEFQRRPRPSEDES